MKGWEDDRAPGFVLGQDIDRASPKNKQLRASPRGSPSNQLSPLPKGRRNRGANRLRTAQTKVLRAVKVQRAMMAMGAKRKNARTLWTRGATKLATVLGFKWLGSDHVQRRKRSIFGNVRGAAPIDDMALPRISLHNNGVGRGDGFEGANLFDLGGAGDPAGPGADAAGSRAAATSTVMSLKVQQRRASTQVKEKVDGTGRNNLYQHGGRGAPGSPAAVSVPDAAHERKTRGAPQAEPASQGRLTATPETVRKQLLKKKMKGAITKVKKFVRTVRLSYADTFNGSKRVSLNELLGRLRTHYDPDGVHADANDSQHHFYTDLALLQRESLKHDPRVRRVLDFIWEATDRDGSGTIDKDEYMVMCTKVYRAVVDDTDSPEAHAEIKRIAEEDWDADRQGHDHLDYNRFTRAWFQLADHWTHDLSPESYEKFLSNIFVSLTERDANGHIVWRNDKDIHHYDPEADDAAKESLLSAAFVEKKVVKKKRKKTRSSSGMSQEALEKYMARMNANKKVLDSREAHVAIVQEGTFDRNTRLAKINSRNGLYIGSVVPPPEGWDEELTHKMINQSAFMRISLKGDKGVYSRGADDSSDDEGGDEWMTAAGTSYLDAYPRELSQSLKKLALSTQLREGADKEKTSALLGRLWEENTPWNTRSIGSSPGGPGGWLVHFTREGEEKQDPRLQTGTGGGFGLEREHPENTGMASFGASRGANSGVGSGSGGGTSGGKETGMNRTRSFDDMYRHQQGKNSPRGADGTNRNSGGKMATPSQDPLAGDHPFQNSMTGSNLGQQNRPGSAPASRRRSRKSGRVGVPAVPAPTPMGRPGTASSNPSLLTRKRKKKRKQQRRRAVAAPASASAGMVRGAGGVLFARPSSAHNLHRRKGVGSGSNFGTGTTGARKKKLTGSKSTGSIKRRPKSAPRTRMKRRKQPRPGSKKAASSQSALETSAEMAMAESSGRRRRPRSAHPIPRRKNKVIEGTHIFDALSRPHDSNGKSEAKALVGLGLRKAKEHASTVAKRPGQKITLLRLKPTCTANDICDIFGALGLPIVRGDIRMSKVKQDFRKAKVVFRRYTDYKQAVQLLGILNGAVPSSETQSNRQAATTADSRVEKMGPPVVSRLPPGNTNDVRPISSMEEIQKVEAVNTIRIPKMLRRPMSASSTRRRDADRSRTNRH